MRTLSQFLVHYTIWKVYGAEEVEKKKMKRIQKRGRNHKWLKNTH